MPYGAVSGGLAPPAQQVVAGTKFKSKPSTTSGGNYGGGTSGGGAPVSYPSSSGQVTRVGSSAGPGPSRRSAPAPKPKAPSVQKYLGADSQYQADRADLIKNFRNLRLTNKENRGNLGLDRGTTLNRLGTEQTDALQTMKDDFAARGLYGGAEYQKKLGSFNADYSNQRFDTQQSFQRNIAQLLKDLGNAGTLKEQNLQQARLEAIRRRASEFGITGGP